MIIDWFLLTLLPYCVQNYSFYDLIVTKARGKSGPLFHFDVHEDVRLINDARVEKDEVRQCYELPGGLLKLSNVCVPYGSRIQEKSWSATGTRRTSTFSPPVDGKW